MLVLRLGRLQRVRPTVVLLTRHPCANLFVLAFPFCPGCLGYSELCLFCPNLTAGHFSKSLVPVIEHRVPNQDLDLNVLVSIQGCHWSSQPTEQEHVCLPAYYVHMHTYRRVPTFTYKMEFFSLCRFSFPGLNFFLFVLSL